MTLDFPFNNSNYSAWNMSKPYRIKEADDLTYLYIGSVANKNVTAEIVWRKANAMILYYGFSKIVLFSAFIIGLSSLV